MRRTSQARASASRAASGGMIGKELHGLVVHAGEAVADQRRGSVGENRADKVSRLTGLRKNRLSSRPRPAAGRGRRRSRRAERGVRKERRDPAPHRLVRVGAGLRPRVDDAKLRRPKRARSGAGEMGMASASAAMPPRTGTSSVTLDPAASERRGQDRARARRRERSAPGQWVSPAREITSDRRASQPRPLRRFRGRPSSTAPS